MNKYFAGRYLLERERYWMLLQSLGEIMIIIYIEKAHIVEYKRVKTRFYMVVLDLATLVHMMKNYQDTPDSAEFRERRIIAQSCVICCIMLHHRAQLIEQAGYVR